MEFSEKLRNLLKVNRLSQADLAESLGTNQQQVSRWVDSNTPPKVPYLLKLARALGVTVDYLIDDARDDPMPSRSLLTADEERALWLIRELGLSSGEVLRRLAGEPGGKALGEARLFRTRDLEAEEEARKLGPQPGQEGRVVAEGQDDRPLPGDGL